MANGTGIPLVGDFTKSNTVNGRIGSRDVCAVIMAISIPVSSKRAKWAWRGRRPLGCQRKAPHDYTCLRPTARRHTTGPLGPPEALGGGEVGFRGCQVPGGQSVVCMGTLLEDYAHDDLGLASGAPSSRVIKVLSCVYLPGGSLK